MKKTLLALLVITPLFFFSSKQGRAGILESLINLVSPSQNASTPQIQQNAAQEPPVCKPREPALSGLLAFPNDQSFCSVTPTFAQANVAYSVTPSDSFAILKSSWKIVNPVSKAKNGATTTKLVTGSGVETLSGEWPGIDSSDTLVELTFTSSLLNPDNGKILATDSFTYTWNPATTCPPQGLELSGKVWELQKGQTCATTSGSRTKINPQPGDKVQKVGSISSNISDSDGSYKLTDPAITNPSNQLCATALKPDLVKWGSSAFYKIKCVDGTVGTPLTPNCANLGPLAPSGTYTVNLGFEVVAKGWTHVLMGDIYAGCPSCPSNAISQLVPKKDPTSAYDTDVIYFLDSDTPTNSPSMGVAIAKGDIVVKDPDGNTRISDGDSSNKNYNVKNYQENKLIWPFVSSLNQFQPPVGAKEVTNCSNFFSGSTKTQQTYYMSKSCFGEATASNVKYKFDGSGAVVLYIINAGSLNIKNELVSQTNNRLILMVDGEAVIDPGLGTQTPKLSNLSPQIDATILAKDGILIDCDREEGTCTGNDSTFVLQGALLSKKDIVLNRLRGLDTNEFPSEIVKYAPEDLIYLNEFNKDGKISGLHIQRVTWQTR
ncbi:MAG: hypothetical protein AAB443_04615 [Patescibacteria group bacterium]